MTRRNDEVAGRRPLWLVSAVALIAVAIAVIPSPSARAEEPIVLCHEPIAMRDGIVLYANVSLPGSGQYPTILTSTPYGKDDGQRGSECPVPNSAEYNAAGYARIIVDLRGWGRSQGVSDGYGPQDVGDAAEVLDWIQAQPWSDGKVGVTGCSGLGTPVYMTATADQHRIAAGKPRAVYTAWVDGAPADLPRDALIGPGGAGSQAIYPAALSLVVGGKYQNFDPSDRPPDQLGTFFLWPLAQPQAQTTPPLDWQIDGDLAYDGPFWWERRFDDDAHTIDIPFVTSAAVDDAVFLERAAFNYFEKLVSSPNRKLFMSPGLHCTQGHYEDLGFGSSTTEFKISWFDRWLKDVDNGIDDLPDINVYPFGDDRWHQFDYSPELHGAEETTWQRFYLSDGPSGSISSVNDGRLTTEPPTSTSIHSLPYLPANDFFRAGAPGAQEVYLEAPGVSGEETMLTYTTEPLAEDMLAAGLMTVQLFASMDRDDGTLIVRLTDVAPDGSITFVNEGALRASLGALDTANTAFGPGGEVVRPYFQLTRESKQLVAGTTRSYFVELDPQGVLFRAGHRIRVTVAASDSATLLPSAAQKAESAGGTLNVSHGPGVLSNLLLPLVPIG